MVTDIKVLVSKKSVWPVRYDTATLVFPEPQQFFFRRDDATLGVDHALPDSGQVTQVENVVKLGWSGQHLDL